MWEENPYLRFYLFENDIEDNDLLVIDSSQFIIDSILAKEEEGLGTRFTEKETHHA